MKIDSTSRLNIFMVPSQYKNLKDQRSIETFRIDMKIKRYFLRQAPQMQPSLPDRTENAEILVDTANLQMQVPVATLEV